jgi:DNA-3-methyladenine glycosylase
MKPVAQAFFMRDTVTVARELVGMRLRRGRVVLRITEVEAYLGPDDTACHTAAGRTARNAAMWGPGGHAYVYLCYGIHHLLNIVTGDGDGTAVLIRSCEAVGGLATVLERRGGKADLAGPGKVGQALALDTSWSHHPLFRPGGLELLPGEPDGGLLLGPRVGIDYAAEHDRDAPLRFADANSRAVTRRANLKPCSKTGSARKSPAR